jgi:REP element-mobilizing transposase RayT
MKNLPTRRNTNRIPQHDYSTPGCYFVTVCAQSRDKIFGIIENNQIILNDIGKMVDFWWREMFNKYPNISIDEYIVMPNHAHGLIDIVGAGSPRPGQINGRGNRAPTIGHIIAFFKYQTTKQINESQNMPGNKIWQRNYYDPVIRNDIPFHNVNYYAGPR